MFNGPEGRLEGKYVHANRKSPPVALILHPHPLHGGTMNNKVVYNTYKAFVENNFSVLRINFRGVGKSQGKFDHGIGELTDAATALDWLQLQNPDSNSYWIAGFSFGAWIAMQLLMRRPEIQHFIAISPPANKYDFSFLSPCPASGIIIQGDNDSIVNEESVNELYEKISKQKNAEVDYSVIHKADHFFRNKMDELNEILMDYIKNRSSHIKPKRIKPDRRRKQILLDD